MDIVKIIEQYLPSIIMIIIGLFLGNQDRKRTANAEMQQRQMTEWFKNVKECIVANNAGTLALAVALKQGDTNGGLTKAMEKIEAANNKFNDFVNDLALNQLAKR